MQTKTPRRKKQAGIGKDGSMHHYGAFKSAKYCVFDEVVIEPWNSKAGRVRLLSSEYNEDFFKLAHNYQCQKNPFYCGVASMVTVLNALRLDKGTVPSQELLHYEHYDPETDTMERIPYRIYSQLTLLDEETDKIKPRKQIAPITKHQDGDEKLKLDNPGLSLENVAAILEIYETKVQVIHAQEDIDTGIAQLREDAKRTLMAKSCCMIANFDGAVMGSDTGGHFSVVAAYDETSDSVLVLDAAAHKMPWYWVSIEHLYFAMYSLDGDDLRGYMIVCDSH